MPWLLPEQRNNSTTILIPPGTQLRSLFWIKTLLHFPLRSLRFSATSRFFSFIFPSCILCIGNMRRRLFFLQRKTEAIPVEYLTWSLSVTKMSDKFCYSFGSKQDILSRLLWDNLNILSFLYSGFINMESTPWLGGFKSALYWIGWCKYVLGREKDRQTGRS